MEAGESHLLAGCRSLDAAERLLLTTQRCGGDWVSVEATTLTRLDVEPRPIATSRSSFSAVDAFNLRDNPPRKGSTETAVYRLTLADNGPLDAAIVAKAAALETTTNVSNVGGAHSNEERFEEGAGFWHSALRPVLCEALRVIEGSELAEVTGWINASGPTDYNLLHDHGDADWSAVYFAQDGGGGELLLRTQLEPFTHDCGVFPVAPIPGHLWLFPGYLTHAVMPRALGDDGCTSRQLRISVACNIFLVLKEEA